MANKEIKFSKEQILSSEKFAGIDNDILRAVLEDKQYSLKEAKKIIDEFKKKEVQ